MGQGWPGQNWETLSEKQTKSKRAGGGSSLEHLV
jgi:hypothetical protein